MMKPPTAQVILTPFEANAIFAGHKTQIRRTDGLAEINACPDDWRSMNEGKLDGMARATFRNNSGRTVSITSPLGTADSTLYGLEDWFSAFCISPYVPYPSKTPTGIRCLDPLDISEDEHGQMRQRVRGNIVLYRAAIGMEEFKDAIAADNFQWEAAADMPKHYCRSWLMVQSVRAMRLQEITETDACFEGILSPHYSFRNGDGRRDYRSAVSAYWDSQNGAGSWDRNPFVFAASFARMEVPPCSK